MTSKAKGPNPKDLQGAKKPPLHLVPGSAVAYIALALADGEGKYGLFNWRDKDVLASIYVSACKRHIDLWFNGQDMTTDTKLPNLGAAMACLAILVDAQVSECLIDDRPIPQDLEAVYEMAKPILAGLREQHAKLPQNMPAVVERVDHEALIDFMLPKQFRGEPEAHTLEHPGPGQPRTYSGEPYVTSEIDKVLFGDKSPPAKFEDVPKEDLDREDEVGG